MAELADLLRSVGPEVVWPDTPDVAGRLETAPRPSRRRRRALLVAVAAAVLALGVAIAVPQARSSILRFLHIGSVTIERVTTLPPAQEGPLAVNLGARVTAAEAESVLGQPFLRPDFAAERALYERQGVVSALLATPEPVLLSQSWGTGWTKKLAGTATRVVWVRVAPGIDGIFITGATHVYIGPKLPPRLAGNTLLWEDGGITFRLEGPGLTKQKALELAREISSE